MTITVCSLFSGIGGFDLGLERAGMKVVCQVENDPYCQKVLAKHWPDVKRHGDVRECGKHNLESVDLICGGFPCQPVSYAGKQKGDDDERWLWPEFSRIIRCLEPRWVVAENVPGLLSNDAGRLFGTILRDLAACGYDAEWDCIPAAAFGAPHIRDRVFIVAHAMRFGVHLQRGRIARSSRQGAVHTDGDGSIRDVADADSRRLGRRQQQSESRQSEGEVAYDDRSRQWHVQGHCAPAGTNRCVFAGPDNRRPEGEWSPEPDVGRVAHGVPARVDRLRGLGNAVVPQVAEWIGRRIVMVNGQ